MMCEGNKMAVSILMGGDVVDDRRGMSDKQLYEPIYKKVKGRKVPEWTLEGVYKFNISRVAAFLKPFIDLNDSSVVAR